MLSRSQFIAITMVGAVAGWALLAVAQNQPPRRAATPAEKPAASAKSAGEKAATTRPNPPAANAAEDADTKAVRESAAAFTKLYNAHNAEGLAALFALQAEVVDEAGNLVKGREAIQAAFVQQFQAEPNCTMQVDVESIRLLTPNIAVEEGVARSAFAPGEPEDVSMYTCVHVKVDGRWLLASVKDFEAPAPAMTPHEHLQELAWMVGNWVDESPDASIHSTCDWDQSGNFLINHFAVQMRGQLSMHGTIRIGWDAVANQFRSWVFDSEGGFTEGMWIRAGDEWIVKLTGATAAGETCSATSVYRWVNNDTFTFRSYDRIVNGALTENVGEVVIKRRLPPPAE